MIFKMIKKAILFFVLSVLFVNKSSAQVLINEEEKEVHEGEGAQKYWRELEEAIKEKNEENGIEIPNRAAFKTKEFYEHAAQQRNNLSVGGQWSQVVQANTNQQGGGMGRVEDVAFDPNNNSIFYVATAGGGLWKTINDGASFFCTTSGLPVTGVSSVVVDYSNSSIIYIFTGSAQGNVSAGVFKSTNGGSSWVATGLQDSIYNPAPLVSYDLKMLPTSSNVLYAATNKGLYRTINGGTSWVRVLEGVIFDVEFKPQNPNIIYASTYQKVWTSTVYGDTATWKSGEALFGFQYPTQVVSLGFLQIRIAVSTANPSAVYACASIINQNDSVYSADGGSFYVKYNYNSTTEKLEVSQYPTKIQSCFERMLRSGYGRDYSDIYVGSSGLIFIMGLEAMASLNTSGISWVLKSKQCTGGNRWMHVDAGKIKFSNGYIYACTDGGLFRQAENYNNANLPWTDLTAGVEITQSYVHAATPQDAEMYIYANQDNGTHVRTSSTVYNTFVGGDGTSCAINPTNKNIYYGSVQNGEYLTRIDNGIATNITPGAGCNCKDTSGYSGSFVFGRAFMQQPFNNNYLVAAKNRLYVSSNKGTTWATKIITGSVKTHYIARISTTNSSNTIYVVEDSTGRLVRSTNYGATWTDVTASKPFNGIISDLAISPINDLDIYISYYGNSADSKIFRSTDGGINWTNLSTGLPNVDARTIALTGSANGVYLGNDFGVYYRDDNTNGWISFSNNLPIVMVMNLAYDATNAKISAATFGRGIWVSDAYNILDCPVTRTLNSIYFNRNTFSASSDITSTGTVYQDYNSRITFSAGNVVLSPGFSAAQNSNFVATAQGCLPEPVLLRQGSNIMQPSPEKDIEGNLIYIPNNISNSAQQKNVSEKNNKLDNK